jgi:metallo-beta-lactamase class B
VLPPFVLGAALALALTVTQAPVALLPDPPRACGDCAAWNEPREPFRVFGNTYFVGTAGLSAMLIASDQGLILLDGGLPQSAPLIDANIRKLGFRTDQITLILNSHAHYDHAGGIAALQRASGAVVVTSASGARAFASGENTPDDPQYGFGRAENSFPPVTNARIVTDGEVVRAGDLAVTAHMTPGHTPGSTTWTWQSCEGARCLDIVYADSLTPAAAPGFRYSGDARTPERVALYRESIAKVAELPCDIIVSVHPGVTNIDGKLKLRAAKPAVDPFIAAGGCRAYAAAAGKLLDARMASESKPKQ